MDVFEKVRRWQARAVAFRGSSLTSAYPDHGTSRGSGQVATPRPALPFLAPGRPFLAPDSAFVARALSGWHRRRTVL